MKKVVKHVSLLLTLILLIGVMSVGCKKDTTETKTAAETKTTESGVAADEPATTELEAVELNGYLLGEAPAGFEKMMAALNEKLQADINTTVTINYISWGDFASKYPLILAAGEDVDFIYTANWSFYAQEAAKGAFYEITEDNMKQNMPLHYATIDKAAFDQTMVNGKMYMVTTSSPDKKIPMMAIRGDLRKKYGVAEVENFTGIEAYLKAIKDNEPDMIPMNLDSTFDIGAPFGALVGEQGVGAFDILFSSGSGSGVVFSCEDSEYKLEYMLNDYYLPQFKSAAVTMKDWFDKGYVNQDVFANDVRSKDAFLQGTSGIAIGNSTDMQSVLATGAANGWEIELVPLLNGSGHYLADPFINNGVAVASSSKNPERTMMFLDRIMEDKAYNYLVYFGIEGENYVVKDEKIDLPDGVTADTNTYPPDAAGFWFTNKNQFLPLASWDDAYVALKDQLNSGDWLVNNPLSAFSPQVDSVATEVANLNQTIVQYLQPIYIGLVPDVDAAFVTLDEQLKAAGVEKVQAELQKQVDSFVAK